MSATRGLDRPAHPTTSGSHAARQLAGSRWSRLLARRTMVVVGVIIAVASFGISYVYAQPAQNASALLGGETSFWAAKASPRHPVDPDRRPVELGVRFTTTTPGLVTALMFYQTQVNVGPHSGSLWDSAGHRLAGVAFVPSRSTGWQVARLSRPVRLSANTAYVASYHSPAGGYSADTGYFASRAAYRVGPLTATAGVYSYGTSSTLPTQQWEGSNYYVDVVFRPDAGAPMPQPALTPAPAPAAPGTLAPTKAPVRTPAVPVPTTSPTTPAPLPPPPPPVSTGSTTWPDSSNTGAAGSLPTQSDTTVTTDGATLSNIQISGQLTINANNVTLRNVRIVGTGSAYGILVNGKNLLIEDSTISGAGATTAGVAAADAGQFVARRINVSGSEDGVRMSNGSKLLDSYVHDLRAGPTAHNDGVTADGFTGWEITHNTIVNSIDQTAAVWVGDPRFGPSEGVLQNNFLAGGGYTVYGGPGTGAGVRVIGNHFSTKYFPGSGYWGPVAYWSSSDTTWSNNVWADGFRSGAVVSP